MALILSPTIVFCLTPFIIIAVPEESNNTSALNATFPISSLVPQESNNTSVDFNVTHSASTLRQTTWTSPASTIFNYHTNMSSTEQSRFTSSPTGTTESGAGDHSGLAHKEATSEVSPTLAPDNNLTMLAFGVMSFILILIVIMVILVTVVNCRECCYNTKEGGVKSYTSMASDSHLTNNADKESITLISVRTINGDNDSESLQISSVQSTFLDIEDQELSRDLFTIR